MLRQLRAFLVSNGTSLASVLPSLWLVSGKANVRAAGFVRWYLATCFRLVFIVFVLHSLTIKKRKELRSKEDSQGPSSLELWLRLFAIAAPLETMMTIVGINRFTRNAEATSWSLFVLKTFVFELFMDFGHYVAHRGVHMSPTLYRLSGHKVHHAVHKPTALATFCQDPIDVLISNVIPVLGSLQVMHELGICFSRNQLLLALGYKTWIEVAGHIGVPGRASSFPQMIWLPRVLGIHLETKDHDLHHTQGGKHNFSKRFTIYDRMFGTFKEAPSSSQDD